MGVELELTVLLAVTTLGATIFAKFEIETPRWRKLLKWSVVHGGTVGLYFAVGHWALLFPGAMLAAGVSVHLWWCRRNGIHPLDATPRARYYALRGWPAWE